MSRDVSLSGQPSGLVNKPASASSRPAVVEQKSTSIDLDKLIKDLQKIGKDHEREHWVFLLKTITISNLERIIIIVTSAIEDPDSVVLHSLTTTLAKYGLDLTNPIPLTNQLEKLLNPSSDITPTSLMQLSQG